MQIKPISDNILVEQIKEEKTKSGILIPETAEAKGPVRGLVAAAGPGRKDKNGNIVPMEVKAGDKILFNKRYGSEEIKTDNKEYLIIKEEDVLAILE